MSSDRLKAQAIDASHRADDSQQVSLLKDLLNQEKILREEAERREKAVREHVHVINEDLEEAERQIERQAENIRGLLQVLERRKRQPLPPDEWGPAV